MNEPMRPSDPDSAMAVILRTTHWTLETLAHEVRGAVPERLEDTAEMLTTVARLLRERATARMEKFPH